MKLKCAIILLLFVVLLFNSCTAEPRTDIYGFCRRMNKLEKAVVLDESALYYDGEEYSFFIKVGQRDCILALSTDSEACVESVRLTTLYNETAMSEESKAAIFNYYILLCSVLTSRPADEITQLLSKYSADYNSVDFTDNSIEAEAEKYNCFIYTNGQFISLHCTLL